MCYVGLVDMKGGSEKRIVLLPKAIIDGSQFHMTLEYKLNMVVNMYV